MIRFYIVDDEQMIREGICECLDWAGMGAQVVGSAANGMIAVEEIQALCPDVVITDVVMPRMDGLELARTLRRSGWDGEIIFMSAYREMDYVKSAFKCSAADFIFKPINNTELINVIKQVIERVETRDSTMRIVDNAQMHSLELQWEWLLHPEKRARPVYDRQTAAIHEYAYNGYFILLLHTHRPIYPLFQAVQKMIAQAEYGILWSMIESETETAAVCALCFEEAKWTDEIKETSEALSSRFIDYAEDLIVICGKPVHDIRDIAASLHDAQERLSLHGTDGWVTPRLSPEYNSYEGQIEKQWAESVADGILSGDMDTLTDRINSLWTDIIGTMGGSLQNIKASCLLFSSLLIEQLQTETDEWQYKDFFVRTSGIISKCRHADDIHSGLIQAVMDLKDHIDSQRSEILLVRQIRQLVEDNLIVADIGFLADQVGLSKNHLARKYKNAAGETINAYITKVRIKEAQRLLTNTMLYINEIALRVGYKDIAYFSKLFKKETGILPKDYRKS